MSYSESHASNFKLIFPYIPVNGKTSKKPLELYLQTVNLPTLTLGVEDVPTQYRIMNEPTGSIDVEDLSVTFLIDDKWYNYQLLLQWIQAIKNPTTLGFNKLPVNASLILLTSNGNPAITLDFSEVWPTSLGPVNLNAADNTDSPLICSATFNLEYMVLSDQQ